MYRIDPDRQLDVLRWLMFAWDSQWLGRTTALHGPVEAGKLHTRVRTAFGKLEMRALLNMLGKPRADNLADAADMLQTYLNLALGERGFDGRFEPVQTGPGGGPRLRVALSRMTALDTLKSAAQAAGESPAQACELLWLTWLETLLPDVQLQVTMWSQDGRDVFQVDSLIEPYQTSALPLAAEPAALPATDNELSPVAAALQIPLDQIIPPLEGPTLADNPSDSGLERLQPDLASFMSPPQPSVDPDKRPAPARPSQGLTDRLNRRQSAGSQTSGREPDAKPLPDIGVDPATGRALFSGDPEIEMRLRVERTRALPAITRMFMSKEAKELIAKGTAEPAVKVSSLAANIDLILQRRLSELRSRQPGALPETFRVIGGPQGELQIVVGPRIYHSVGEVPPGPYRDLLQAAVDEWTANQQ